MNTEERKRVERVARDVLGWAIRAWDDFSPPTPAADYPVLFWTVGGECSLYEVPASGTGRPWNPFASASDDYMVLECVREQWDIPDEILFADALKRRFAQRAWCLENSYMKGDYAASALEVIDDLNSRIDAQTQETPG